MKPYMQVDFSSFAGVSTGFSSTGFVVVKYSLYIYPVEPTTNDENATVEVLGNKNLKDGENVITILVKSSKTNETTTYQITVDKKIAQEEKQSIFPKISAKEI